MLFDQPATEMHAVVAQTRQRSGTVQTVGNDAQEHITQKINFT